MKSLLQLFLIKSFNILGYDIRLTKHHSDRHQSLAGKYFNDGKSTYEQNTVRINDCFYRDPEVMAAYYQGHRLEFFQQIVALINKLKCPLKNKSILDIGCGSGHLIKYISESFSPKSVSGYDFSPAAIDYARQLLPQGKYYVLDIYKKPFHEYDFVLCTEVLEHLEYPAAAIRNILAATKKSGACLITVPNGRKDTLEEHINFWSPESWKVFINTTCKDASNKIKIGLLSSSNNYAYIIKK
jgi:2-polyprenyl-3-methyl-5-hydroxy-6-metoxy-1,4-benzoquinol methylase